MKVSNQQHNISGQTKKVSDKYKGVPKPYMDFAKGQERIFTNHLLKEMRKSIQKTEEDSSAEKYYKSIRDDELARIMSESETGIGIKDVVLDQIYPQYKRVNQNAHQAYNIHRPKQGVRDE